MIIEFVPRVSGDDFNGGSDSYLQFRDTSAPCLLKLCVPPSNGIVRWWLFPNLVRNCRWTILPRQSFWITLYIYIYKVHSLWGRFKCLGIQKLSYKAVWSWHMADSVVIRLQAGQRTSRVFDYGQGQKMFAFSKTTRTAIVPIHAPSSMGTGSKATKPWRQILTSPYIDEFKNKRSYTSTRAQKFIVYPWATLPALDTTYFKL